MLLLLNAILFGFLIALSIHIILDRQAAIKRDEAIKTLFNHTLEARKDITEAFKYIRRVNNSHSKIMKLIDKAQDGIKTAFSAVHNDIEHLIQVQKLTTKTVEDGMHKHNALADALYEGFQDIWCELSCDDCASCPYNDMCDEDHSHPDLSKYMSTPDSPKGTITIDPKEDNNIDKIKEKMESSGIPEKVIEQFIQKIEKLINNSAGAPITLVWDSLVPIKSHSESRKVTPLPDPDKANKLIDPNSKIVKSLNRIYNNSKNQ